MPATHSSLTKRNGPLPVKSPIGSLAGVCATRSGMMKQLLAPERVQHAREWRGQPDAERGVGGCAHLRRELQQPLAEGVALAPAADGGDRVAAPDRLAVMEPQSIPQREIPREPVIRRAASRAHLRLRRQPDIDAVERVVDHKGVRHDHDRRRPDRVGHGIGRLRHEPQRPRRCRLGEAGPWQREAGQGGAGGDQAAAMDHARSPPRGWPCVARHRPGRAATWRRRPNRG